MSTFPSEYIVAGRRSSSNTFNSILSYPPVVCRCSSSCAVAAVMGCCGALKSVRCTMGIWLLGLFLFLLSIRFPSPSWMQSSVLVVLALLFQCFLRGALSPRPVGGGMRNSIAVVIIMQALVAPFLAISLYPLCSFWCGEGLTRGMLYVSCLPPSSLLAVWVVKEASGRSFLCRYAMLYFTPFFCIWTPLLLFLMSLLPFSSPKSIDSSNAASSSSFTYFGVPGLVLAPLLFFAIFVVGVLAQVLHAGMTSKHRLEDASLQQYVSLFSDGGMLSEVLEVSQERWRSYCAALSFFLLLFTYYVTLSFLLNSTPLLGNSSPSHLALNSAILSGSGDTFSLDGNSTETLFSLVNGVQHLAKSLETGLESLSIASLSSRQLGLFCVISFLWQMSLHGITWYFLRFSSHLLPQTTNMEDSIALLFSSAFKCEALLIPLCFFFSFGSRLEAPDMSSNSQEVLDSTGSLHPGLFMACVLHLGIQTLFTFLIIPLKRWRMYANCRPGTVMFPVSYDRFYRGKYRR